jgi:2-C-methyl-D-erythritol 4-phosphate cytidylyltransferase/2-C-methyl-D-erythritol 2,4-cyclodiphosphate synthase
MLKMKQNNRYWVIIPAAGIGNRFGAKIPKQYLMLGEKTVLETTLSVFLANQQIEKIIIAISPNDNLWQTLAIANNEKIITCIGGVERADSVQACLDKLNELSAQANDWVLVHDAVRPYLTQNKLNQLITKLSDEPVGGLLAMPVRDTLKKANNEQSMETISRDNLWAAQTPQMFRYKILFDAMQMCANHHIVCTDEAMAVELLQYQPKFVLGALDNIKITYPEDLQLTNRKIEYTPNLRIGHGYDVHQFTDSKPLVLGGVEIKDNYGLLGHSDADVVLHALCDALLGALALGDIGHFYPDYSTENAGRDSKEFLQEIYHKVNQLGFKLLNADITILAQVPKLAPHIEKMRECISNICSVSASQISVKATTTEKLGFVGRKEGIAAHAVVLLSA